MSNGAGKLAVIAILGSLGFLGRFGGGAFAPSVIERHERWKTDEPTLKPEHSDINRIRLASRAQQEAKAQRRQAAYDKMMAGKSH